MLAPESPGTAELIETVGRRRARGIIIDVASLDVLDSFATRTLTQLAHVARLRGAETVVVGIAPEVAMAMVQFSLQMEFVHTALDLEEGLLRLAELTAPAGGQAFAPARPG
jgi:rsbT antagonist protein RsbS